MADGMQVETNAGEIAASLEHAGVIATARAVAVTRHYGQMLLTTARRNASLPRTAPRGPGTGGPRLQTGNLVRSLNLRVITGPGMIAAEVGTNAPQARRLEFGFTGVDALGRRYHQPPYPYLGPALDEIAPQFVAAIAAIADGL